MNIPRLLERYWLPHLVGISQVIRFDDDRVERNIGDPVKLIGLNPKLCRCCNEGEPCLDYDVLQWEKNMLIVTTATKCLLCNMQGSDSFAIHFCENCHAPIEPRGKKFMYSSQYRELDDMEVCEKCFDDLGGEEATGSIFGK